MILKSKINFFSQMLNAAISMEIYQQESGWKGPRYFFIIYFFIVSIFPMMQVSPQSDGGVCAAGQQTGAGSPQERGAGPGDWVEEGGGPEHHGAPPPHLPADQPAELQKARSLRESPKNAFTLQPMQTSTNKILFNL